MNMRLTVKQLANQTGVSVRTLHYYDEVDLLKPSSIGSNGYRYYGEESILRLQQILFYRELDFSLEEIKAIIDEPGFDILHALQEQHQALLARQAHLKLLIQTVEKTIQYVKGEQPMSTQDLFEGFSEEQQAQYEEEAARRWDEQTVRESNRRWRNYSAETKAQIKREGEAIHRDLLANMNKGYASPEVQAVIARWHQHLRYFYEPSLETLAGLADLYNDDPNFRANYEKLHPDMPAFVRKAILHYCESLRARQ
jgi:DNA-binding transcriptional MerR regulator